MDLLENVLFILTVPAEYSEREKAIMRDCAHDAKLIGDRDTDFLQFTTERMFDLIFNFGYIFKFRVVK